MNLTARLALCIGINDYPGFDNDLGGCLNDADDWQAELQRRGFDTRKLLDSAASGAAIRAAIADLLSQASSGDAVVITYSGHGTWLPDSNGDERDHRDEALCPHDVAQNGPLVDDELAVLFDGAAPGVRLSLISDSCHSGTLTRLTRLSRPIGDGRRTARFLPPSAFPTPPRRQPAAKPRSAALLLSGCRDAEYCYDASFDDRPNGAFTHVALAALATLPSTATYREWLTAIRTQLPSQDFPQTPTLVATPTQSTWPALS